jgi:ABC-2 type transport system permease protein
LAWPFVYLTLLRLLRVLRATEEVGPLLASRLLALGFLVFLGILLLSNVIAALSSFFLARDLPAIRAAPIDGLAVYLARLVETAVSSSWMVVLILVPVLAAYGRAYGGGVGFVAVAGASVLPLLVVPAAVGTALTLLLVRVFPARRSRDLLAVIGVAGAALLVLLLRLLRPERLVNPESYRNLVDFLAALRAPASPWLPSQWAADATFGVLEGPFDAFFLLLLWTTAAGTVVVGAVLHGRLYPSCFTKAQEGSENQVRRTLGWRGLERLLSPLSPARRELVLKDVRIFFRDATQWSQLVILGVLVVVYVYNIRVLPIGSEGAVTRYLVTLVVFLNLALSGFVLAAVAARFVFPALSLEGRTLWLLRSAPVTPRDVLASKFWVGAVPLTVLALALTTLTDLFLGVPPGLLVVSVLTIVGLSLAFTAEALALGVWYPEFETENAAQIPTSVGGLLFMLCALLTLGLVVAAQIWSLRGYLRSGLPWYTPRDPLAIELGLALGWTAIVCGIATVASWRTAVRKLGTIGR